MFWRRVVREICCSAITIALLLSGENPHAQEHERIQFGIGTHFAQSKGNPGSDLDVLSKIGFNSFRDELYWAGLEKRRKEFSVPLKLMPYDRAIGFSKELGVWPLIVLSYGNPLYAPKGMPRDDAGRQAFADYAAYLASRYQRRVYGYEIWNEWNNSAGNKDKSLPGDVGSYWQLVQTVAPVLRRIDEEAKIIVGAVAGKEKKWLLDLVRQDGFEKIVDGISVHPYNFCDGRGAYPEDTINWLLSLEESVYRVRNKPVPIYVTEIGWPTNIGRCGTDAEVAGDYLARLFLLAPSVLSLKGLYIYDYRNDGTDKANKEHNFGIVDIEGNEKPAVPLLRDALGVLKSARFQSVETRGDFFFVKYLSGSGEKRYFAWRKNGPQKTVGFDVDCEGNASFAVRILGGTDMDKIDYSRRNNSCRLNLPLDSRPLEIVKIIADKE